MLVSEEELSVQVTEIDGIEVHDVDFAKASKHEVFQQFASNSSCANHQNSCLGDGVSLHCSLHDPQQMG
jgi:hypothetical protein